MDSRKARLPALLLILAFVAACGGGGGSTTGGSSGSPSGGPPPPPPPPAVTPTSIKLTSDAGDYIGGGSSYTYSQANATVSVTAQGGHLSVRVQGDESWTGDFQLPSGDTMLQVGTYTGLARYPFHDPAVGGMDWSGQGRGCNTLNGSLTISQVRYEAGALAEITMQFVQYCEGGTAALHGDLYWNAQDTTVPPGPQAIPGTLWQPAAGTTPATGNYVYLESQSGDYIGGGLNYLYTQANALLSVSAPGGLLGITVTGDQQWTGDFLAMAGISPLQTGYYSGLQRYPFNNPSRGGLSWSGAGRGCNTLTGWFAIDSISYVAGALSAIDLRFEQHCEGGVAALHGKIHWTSSDSTAPAGPTYPIPAGLWRAPAGATPASGNYVYLESQPGDFVGGGATYSYTQANAVLSVTGGGGLVSVGVTGNESWGGDFQAMVSLSRLQAGYYGGVQRYPFNNPVTGGLDWSGQGRGCNTLTGWFVIDSVTYSGASLVAIDLRFEQHCEGGGPALHGQIHWAVGDTTSPPGPVVPPPAGLWQAPSGVTPATGNYVYLESQAGDYVGAGANYLYTQANAQLGVAMNGADLSVIVTGDASWNGDFKAMIPLTQLQVGYYGGLQRYPFNNPVKGGLNWSGAGRGCNTLSGWFVVDNVTYSGGSLSSIDLRFEQHCEGAAPALHGQIHWAVGDTTAPPGPVVPPPAGLWQPPASVLPGSGNYVYLESQAGDYVGAGANYLYTSANASMSLSAPGGHLTVNVGNTSESWSGDFQTMNSINYLQLGYYGNLQRYPFNNPVVGGLSWIGQGRGCNTLTGWFVVDSVTYTGVTLTAIDLRFEQHCEGGAPALHGKIHWAP